MKKVPQDKKFAKFGLEILLKTEPALKSGYIVKYYLLYLIIVHRNPENAVWPTVRDCLIAWELHITFSASLNYATWIVSLTPYKGGVRADVLRNFRPMLLRRKIE